MTTLTEMPYREAPEPTTFHVRATVRGPLALVPMSGRVVALDEGAAIERFVEGLQRDGFEVVGEPSALAGF